MSDEFNSIPDTSTDDEFAEKKPIINGSPESNKKDDSDSKKKPAKKKSKSGVDKNSLIFFAILVVGILIFAIIMIHNSKKKSYVTHFGDKITVTFAVNETKCKLKINADGTEKSVDGTCKRIAEDSNEFEVFFDNEILETNASTKTTEKDTEKSSEEKKATAKFILSDDEETLTYITSTYKLDFKKGE